MFTSSSFRAIALGLFVLIAACEPTPQERSAQLTAQAIDMMMHERPAEPPSVWSRAAALLEEAVALDSMNAQAYASTVLPNIMMPTVDERDAEEAEQKGRAAFQKAVALDPDHPDVLVAQAIVHSLYDIDYEAAGVALKRAIELAPDHADAHREYGHWHGRTGNYEQALAEYNLAIDLDPLLLQTYGAKCQTLRYLGRLDEAENFAIEAQAMTRGNTNNCLAQIYGTRANYQELLELAENQMATNPNDLNMKYARASALAELGRHEDALALYRELKDQGGIGYTHALAGRADSAAVYIADLTQRITNEEWGWNWALGDLHLALGNVEEAATAMVTFYEAATNAEAKGNLRAWLADSQDPRYVRLRQDPRIQAIIQERNS